VFVNYEKVDQNGHLVVPNDKHEQENEDSDDEEEEVIDYEKDDADEVQITNKYTIDMIA